MAHLGLGIDPVTNDLYVDETGNLGMARDAEAVGQHIRQRLKFFQREWFLDDSAGMPWLDTILGQAYDPVLAEAVIKAEILNTDGVTEITSFSISYDHEKRALNIRDVAVLTTYDQEVSVSDTRPRLPVPKRPSPPKRPTPIVVTDSPPVNTIQPLITDSTPTVGVPISTTTGFWTGSPAPTFTFQWKWADTNANIVGATLQDYTPVLGDLGHRLKCAVTGSNPVTTNTVETAPTSSAVANPNTAPVNTALPTISDTTPTVGEQISASTGTWTGFPAPTFAFQWKRADTNSNIFGATSQNYTPDPADAGHTLRCAVTASNSVDSVTVETAPTSAVSGATTEVVERLMNPATATPAQPSIQAASIGYDMGMQVYFTVPGEVRAVHFWRPAASSTSLAVGIWDATNALVASKVLTKAQLSANGWDTVALDAPLTVTPHVRYTVAWWQDDVAGNVFVPITSFGLASTLTSANGVIVAPATGTVHNGVTYENGVSDNSNALARPTVDFEQRNYFVDVDFAYGGVLLKPLYFSDGGTVLEGQPAGTYVGSLQDETAGGLVELIDDGSGRFSLDLLQIYTTTSPIDYESLPAGKTIDITVRETHPDATNSPRDTVLSIAVLNASEGLNAQERIFPNNISPQVKDSAPASDGLSLGVNLYFTLPGEVRTVHFWRDSRSSSSIAIGIWNSAGTLIASRTLTQAPPAGLGGWDSADFTTPVPVVANTKYTVGWWQAPSSGTVYFPRTDGQFYNPFQSANGVIIVPADTATVNGQLYANGVAGQANSLVYPNAPFEGRNYFVDVTLAYTVPVDADAAAFLSRVESSGVAATPEYKTDAELFFKRIKRVPGLYNKIHRLGNAMLAPNASIALWDWKNASNNASVTGTYTIGPRGISWTGAGTQLVIPAAPNSQNSQFVGFHINQYTWASGLQVIGSSNGQVQLIAPTGTNTGNLSARLNAGTSLAGTGGKHASLWGLVFMDRAAAGNFVVGQEAGVVTSQVIETLTQTSAAPTWTSITFDAENAVVGGWVIAEHLTEVERAGLAYAFEAFKHERDVQLGLVSTDAATAVGTFVSDANPNSVIGSPGILRPTQIGYRGSTKETGIGPEGITVSSSNVRIANFSSRNMGNGSIFVPTDLVLNGVVVEDIDFINAYRGIEARNTVLRDFRFSRLRAYGLEKSLIRFGPSIGDDSGGSPGTPAIIEDCYADGGGEYFWGDRFMALYDFGRGHDILVRRCVARGAYMPVEIGQFRQGDGFLVEGVVSNIRFENCLAELCTDGGWDCKSDTAAWHDCESRYSTRNYKVWGTGVNATGDFVTRSPTTVHIQMTGVASSITIERLIIESTNPDIPILEADLDPGSIPAVVNIGYWEFIGGMPANQALIRNRSPITVNWGPQGRPPGGRDV